LDLVAVVGPVGAFEARANEDARVGPRRHEPVAHPQLEVAKRLLGRQPALPLAHHQDAVLDEEVVLGVDHLPAVERLAVEERREAVVLATREPRDAERQTTTQTPHGKTHAASPPPTRGPTTRRQERAVNRSQRAARLPGACSEPSTAEPRQSRNTKN